MMSEWSSCRERLNEVGSYLKDVTDPQTSRSVSDDLCRINLMWADFVRRAQFVSRFSSIRHNLVRLFRKISLMVTKMFYIMVPVLGTR